MMEFREKNHSARLVSTCDCHVDSRPAQADNRGGGQEGHAQRDGLGR